MKQVSARTLWIDLLLIAGGVLVVIVAGWPVPGGLLLALGLLSPLLVITTRTAEPAGVLRLVPCDLAAGYRSLRDAAQLPGAPLDANDTVEAADDAVLGVAALLAGRPPRGGAERRLVGRHVRSMAESEAVIRERHEAWLAAHAELDAGGPAMPASTDAAPRLRPTVAVLVALMLPLFVSWDLAIGVTRGFVLLLDGVALRSRASVRLMLRGLSWLGACCLDAVNVVRHLRASLVDAAADAKSRAVALRLRLRLRLRLAARVARSR